CLARELREELDVGARVGAEIFATTHAYPERIVELHFLRGTIDGEPRSILGQEIRWVARADLESLQFPPADAELIAKMVNPCIRRARTRRNHEATKARRDTKIFCTRNSSCVFVSSCLRGSGTGSHEGDCSDLRGVVSDLEVGAGLDEIAVHLAEPDRPLQRR